MEKNFLTSTWRSLAYLDGVHDLNGVELDEFLKLELDDKRRKEGDLFSGEKQNVLGCRLLFPLLIFWLRFPGFDFVVMYCCCLIASDWLLPFLFAEQQLGEIGIGLWKLNSAELGFVREEKSPVFFSSYVLREKKERLSQRENRVRKKHWFMKRLERWIMPCRPVTAARSKPSPVQIHRGDDIRHHTHTSTKGGLTGVAPSTRKVEPPPR